MQHDHVLKKLNFELWNPLQGREWVGGKGVRVCGQNICYHVAAFVIPFNLICNMTISFSFIKKSGEILDKIKARDFNATSLSMILLLFKLLYLII